MLSNIIRNSLQSGKKTSDKKVQFRRLKWKYPKADWKLYCERVSDWQEHYMEQLNQEYVNLLTSTGNASDHFWELQKRIKQDKKHPGVLIELRKSTAIWDIAYFVRDQVITLDDLEGFSEDLIDAVKLILSR